MLNLTRVLHIYYQPGEQVPGFTRTELIIWFSIETLANFRELDAFCCLQSSTMFSISCLDKVMFIFYFLLPFLTKKMAHGLSETVVLVLLPVQLLLLLMLFSSHRPELKAIEKETEVTLR